MTDLDRERLATIEADHRHLNASVSSMSGKMDALVACVQQMSVTLAGISATRTAQTDSTARTIGIMAILAAVLNAAVTWWHK